MKNKLYLVAVVALLVPCTLLVGSCGTRASKGAITEEMAYEGVGNYCHQAYDWSLAEENPSLMELSLGEETDAEYQVVFRSYTGALVYFHVDKASGETRIEEYVPALDIRSEAGTIDLFDYLEKGNESE